MFVNIFRKEHVPERSSRACLKKAFCKMCVTICGRFCPDEGVVAGYDNRIRVKSPAKWGVQIAGMIFQTRSKTGKRSGYSISERFLTAMELPGDLAHKAPIITITGPAQVLIENYKSILSYTSEQLIIVTCQGRVILQGKNLEISRYTSLEMEVKGKITAVMLECR